MPLWAVDSTAQVLWIQLPRAAPADYNGAYSVIIIVVRALPVEAFSMAAPSRTTRSPTNLVKAEVGDMCHAQGEGSSDRLPSGWWKLSP
jgi:hypothetical protein